MRMWFRPVKGIAFCIVAAFFYGAQNELYIINRQIKYS